MEVKNSVVPNKSQMAGFADVGPDGPIYMVNLLKFKDKAQYEDGRNTDLTGEQAYALYGESVTELLKEFGGEAIFGADVERLMLGEVEELWDKVAIAMYPSRNAMLQMMMSPTMQEIGQHRAAGLAGQLNIETVIPTNSKLLG
ncbi:MAG: DUF1330 domain-containing protein [Pseudomonadales bacterium]|nr:DUF1330 domain-containing protein [Pseudomonadales bacterium]MDG1441484.1 DUF1330 domain-containing protein [Pseudomonadales bacterium]